MTLVQGIKVFLLADNFFEKFEETPKFHKILVRTAHWLMDSATKDPSKMEVYNFSSPKPVEKDVTAALDKKIESWPDFVLEASDWSVQYNELGVKRGQGYTVCVCPQVLFDATI